MKNLLPCKGYWHRTVMRGSIFIVAILLLGTLCTLAETSSAQIALEKNVTISLRDASLKTALDRLSQVSGASFIYTGRVAAYKGAITIDARKQPLKAVLTDMLKGTPFSFTVSGDDILIRYENEDGPRDGAANSRERQNAENNGRVTDSDGNPLPGATVRVKGTTQVVSTDEQGYFRFENIAEGAILQISYIGYEVTEVPFRDNLVIVLSKSSSKLDDVQVIAYGTTTQRYNTGSVSTVKAADIADQPVTNVLAALHGRVPGLTIQQTSGVPGAAVNVQIRGQNSLIQGSEPLFIVDGVPFASNNNNLTEVFSVLTRTTGGGLSPFSSINPSDIESIEVLKDADATAIYGSRGANGVILITTKRGGAGKAKLTVGVHSGVSFITRDVSTLSTPQYIEMRREAFTNDGVTPTATNAPDLLLWNQTYDGNHRNAVIGNSASNTDAQLTVSGGNEQLRFLFSGGYNYQTTIFPGDLADNRGSIKLGLNYLSLDRKLNLDVSGNYVSDRNRLSADNAVFYSTNLPPMTRFYTDAGALRWEESGVSFQNPMAFLSRKYIAATNNLIGSFNAGYMLLPGLRIKASMGYNTIDVNETATTPISAQDPAFTPTGLSTFNTRKLSSWIIEPQAEYQTTIGQGKLQVLAGGTFQDNTTNSIFIAASGYVNDELLESLAAAPTIANRSSSYSKYRYSAIFGRINYNWSGKYLLNLTGRRDGSSRFGPESRFENFGAVGAAWIFSQEPFIAKRLPFLSFGKIRGSFGVTGNDQIGDYRYLDLFSSITPYQNGLSLVPSSLYNPDYNWESNKKMEGAIELGFLKDRLLLSAAYYHNRSGNQLIQYRLPTQTGFNSITRNFDALIENSGWELQASGRPFQSENLRWDVSFNITLPKNVLLEFPDLATSSYASSYLIGESVNVLKRFRSLGVDPATGVFAFEDVNGDGVLNAAGDYQALGELNPKFFGGLSNNIRYKNFELGLFLEFKKQTGRNYLAALYGGSNIIPGMMFNQADYVLNRWQKPGDQVPVQRFTATTTSAAYRQVANFNNSNGIYGDASYLRLKNVSLSYLLNPSLTSKMKISSLRVFVLGQNLLTATGYKGADPESQDLYGVPPLRTVTAGLQLTL